jgi:hypothetical protein
MSKMQSILYGPENYSMPLLDRAMKAGLAPQAARKTAAKKAAAKKRTGSK